MLQILVFRHGPAGTAEQAVQAGIANDDRPLTEEGRRMVKAAAAGLHELLPRLDRVFSSPLPRARQSAELLCSAFDLHHGPELLPELNGAPLPELNRALAAATPTGTIGVVGHDPQLSRWIGWLAANTEVDFIRLRKSGACLLELSRLEPGEAELQWLLPPVALEQLGQNA